MGEPVSSQIASPAEPSLPPLPACAVAALNESFSRQEENFSAGNSIVVCSPPVRDTIIAPYDEAYQVIEVQLVKNMYEPKESRFGFANVPCRDGHGLLISWIDEHGLLSSWNQAHPDLTISEGDRIVCVNGVNNCMESMRGQLQSEIVRMTLHRRDTSTC